MTGAQFLLFVAFLCPIEGSEYVVSQTAVSSFSINEGNFSCRTKSGGNMMCYSDATSTAEGLLKLTPDRRNETTNSTIVHDTHGVALYHQPVHMLNLNTNQAATLNVSFSLRIESGRDLDNFVGDGMAFVMFSSIWIGSSGRFLGAYSSDGTSAVNTLAVEFDTYKNQDSDDPNNNHVGIDTDSVKSNVAKLVPFILYKTFRVYAWVDYDSVTSELQVRINHEFEKPVKAFIKYTKNLTEIFDEEDVWVGFSGANGLCECFSYYTVYDLSLNSSFPSLQQPSPSPAVEKESKSSVPTGLIAGVTVGIAGALLGVIVFCVRQRKRKMRSRLISGDETGRGEEVMAADENFQISEVSRSLKLFSYDQLRAATKNFSDDMKLGEGGFGSVYRGSMSETNKEVLVAVKKVSSDSRQGEREFVAEVTTIGQLRHRNIVQLLGCCSEGQGNYLLVYEFMANGSLDTHLFPGSSVTQATGQEILPFLSWEVRFKILGGLAAALQYLHDGCRLQVIHRDVKASNIMLDDNFNALLGDFGLARTADHYKNLATTSVAGTVGYIAPEASMTGKFTTRSDVFSFGAVCLEIVCGRKVYDENYPPDEILLVNYMWTKLSTNELLSVVDLRLDCDYNAEEVEAVLLLGLLCSHPNPDERPPMHRVIEILIGSVELPPISKAISEWEYWWSAWPTRRRISSVSKSGTDDRNEIKHQVQLISPPVTSSSSNDTHSGTRSSHASGLTSSSDTGSFQQ